MPWVGVGESELQFYKPPVLYAFEERHQKSHIMYIQSSAKMFRHSLMFEHLSFFLSTHPPYTTP